MTTENILKQVARIRVKKKFHLSSSKREFKYSRHSNTGPVQFPNGPNVSGCWMAQFSNAIPNPDKKVWFSNGILVYVCHHPANFIIRLLPLLTSLHNCHVELFKKYWRNWWHVDPQICVDPNHSKTELTCPVFKWFASTDSKMTNQKSDTKNSDIQVSHIQMPTVPDKNFRCLVFGSSL